MSLTLLYRGKNVRFSMRLNKLHWLSAIVFFALLSGSIFHLMMSTNAVPDQIPYELALEDNLAIPAATNKQQVTALTMKLADLQSQVSRLNALGERLATDAKIPEDEYNFDVTPPSGGPDHFDASLVSKSVDMLLDEVAILEKSIVHEEKQLEMLESLTLGHYIDNTGYLSGRPISSGWLSSYYGIRKDPFNGKPSMHKGLDFAGKEGGDVIATGAGVVTWSGSRYGYGNLIEINHGKGLKTRYGHNKTLTVNVGDIVSKGQVIALMGSTGRSTGPHVHYEILKNNKPIDPIKFVYRKAK